MLETDLPEESLMFFSPSRHGKFTWAIRILVFFVLTSAFGIRRIRRKLTSSLRHTLNTEMAASGHPFKAAIKTLYSLWNEDSIL